jgi:hypothetical protein
VYGIEKYRIQRWRIKRVSGRVSALLALRYVLYPAANVRRLKSELTYNAVVKMVDRLHKLWFNRAKDIIARQLWCPGGMALRSADILTFRRVINCRPSCVFYKRGNKGKLRPCKRDRFCPFCWARTAAFGYRNFKHQLRQARRKQPNLALVYRVLSHKVPAAGFDVFTGYTPAQILAQAEKLRGVIEQHRELHKKLAKPLQRKTLGSAWRVVVNPIDDGWVVEVRQLFLWLPKKTLPLAHYPGTTETAIQSVCAHDDDAVLDTIGKFFEYPAGLMTTYLELVAVYLQASSNMRMLSGTGLFRTAGQSLVRQIKKEKSNGKSQDQAQPVTGQKLSDVSSDVFM